MNPKPKKSYGPAARLRQARLRERRKAEGWRRLSVWLPPEQAGRLETLGGDWLGTTIRELLEQGATARRTPAQAALFDALEPLPGNDRDFSDAVKKVAFMPPEDKAALMREVDSLLSQGLSGGDVACKFNAEGRRTVRGAAFTGRNLIRDWRKWKEQRLPRTDG